MGGAVTERRAESEERDHAGREASPAEGGRALVLGGGGVAGIAWEAGIVTGLRQEGIDLGSADRIVGTSAGSVVGALIATGADLESEIAYQVETDTAAARAF